MGRRSNAELLGILERIVELYTREKQSIKQIADALQSEGYQVSRSGIQRVLKTHKEAALEWTKISEEAKVLIDSVRSTPNTDVLEAVNNLFSRKVFEFVRTIEDLGLMDPEKTALIINRMTQSQVQISKLRLTFENGFQSAKKAVLDTLKEELKNHPDLLDRLMLLVSSMEVTP